MAQRTTRALARSSRPTRAASNDARHIEVELSTIYKEAFNRLPDQALPTNAKIATINANAFESVVKAGTALPVMWQKDTKPAPVTVTSQEMTKAVHAEIYKIFAVNKDVRALDLMNGHESQVYVVDRVIAEIGWVILHKKGSSDRFIVNLHTTPFGWRSDNRAVAGPRRRKKR